MILITKSKTKPKTTPPSSHLSFLTSHLSFLFIFLFSISSLQAAYLENIPMQVIQPNGDTLHCYASGDEFFNYLHDKDGYTIIQNKDGFYMYALYEKEQIVPSRFIAGTVNPSKVGLRPYVVISTEEYQARRAKWFNYQDISRSKAANRNHGTLNNLVVFIRFSDEEEITKSFYTVEEMYNDQTPGYNSMYNYFETTSYGALTIPSTFYPEHNEDTIISYQDIYPRSYYQEYNETTNPNGYKPEERTSREHNLLRRAIEFIADQVPTSIDLDYNGDGFVDNVCFVVKGNVGAWSTLLWPHRWSLHSESEAASIHGYRVWDYNFMLEGASGYFNTAVLSHEMQHSLSYPDLYHYHNGTNLKPVGQWDIMENNPNPPQQSGAYMKWKYGNWLNEPKVIQPGTYTLNSVGTGLGDVGYKIPTSDPDQFFVLEFRDATDPFDKCYNNGTGLLIYRINTNWNGNAGYNPNDDIFDEVYIFRPDGYSPTQNGTIARAHFGPSDRTTFNANSNPPPFLTDGTTVNDLSITDITIHDKQVTFTYSNEIVYAVNDVEKTTGLFTMYPNPANNYLEIALTGEALTMQNINAQFFDLKGGLIKSFPINSNKMQIDISNLSKGFYVVKIGYESKKLIVK
ncbi:MAG: M6 family metalloprotease domain-containing protein [Lentimicrobiaceae bacterium]|nr:M6 family metalloprotease domain-containing protein [Lentimicrobiaceae bacterium]